MENEVKAPRIRRPLFLVVLGVLIVGALAVAGYGVLYFLRLGTSKPYANIDGEYEKYATAENAYEVAASADHNGGKTPKETLNLLVAALQKEDVNLASQYFALQPKSANVWSTDAARELLVQVKAQGQLSEIIKTLLVAEPSSRVTSSSSSVEYVTKDSRGFIERSILLEWNSYGEVWKVVSL